MHWQLSATMTYAIADYGSVILVRSSQMLLRLFSHHIPSHGLIKVLNIITHNYSFPSEYLT